MAEIHRLNRGESEQLRIGYIASAAQQYLGRLRPYGDGRALDASERPIPGLYAAGRVTGGLEGGRPSTASTAW
jgi:predicted oxidoreductase